MNIDTTPEVEALLARSAAVAIGVSGGKDSQACAIATIRHLDAIGHTGPRVLIHSDLGAVEWLESIDVCRDLAKGLGVELMEVGRAAGGLMERWESRWDSSKRRYEDLETVTLVLPWSTPGMRFCTSELKTQVIASALKKRFKDLDILNVTGIRRQESAGRSKAPISKRNDSLCRKGSEFWSWNSIVSWGVEQVFSCIKEAGFELHRGYREFGMGRISCVFCIMSNAADMANSARNPDHTPIYRRMVDLEIKSTFGFQGSRWLADVAPDLLDVRTQAAVVDAKARAARRIELEKNISNDVMFAKGAPKRPLTWREANTIADVRREIGRLIGLAPRFVTPNAVMDHYERLLGSEVGNELVAPMSL